MITIERWRECLLLSVTEFNLAKKKKNQFFSKNDAKYVYWSYQGKICPYHNFDPAQIDQGPIDFL